MARLFDFFRLDNFCASDVMTEMHLNSLVSDLEILMLNGAEVLNKIDPLLKEPLKRALTQDQEIDLGVLKARVESVMKDIDEAKKKL